MTARTNHVVLVAEPAPLLAEILADSLTTAGYEVVHFAAAPSELAQETARLGADVLVVGPSFGRGGLAGVIPQLLSKGIRTVLVSPLGLDRVEAQIMMAGASGYLSATTGDYRDVAAEVSRATGESSPLHPEVVRGMLLQWRGSRQVTSGEAPVQLTPREIDVVRALGDGLTTRLIAARLGLSEKTVEAHKSRLFAKLGAKNSSQALKLVSEQGLV